LGRGVIHVLSLVAALSAVFSSATALADRRSNRWLLDTGVYMSNVDQKLFHLSAPVSSFAGFLRVRRSLSLRPKIWFFEPSIATVLPWRSNPDGNSRVFTAQLSFDFVRSVGTKTRLRFGTGVRSELGVSFGTAVILNNGTGSSTFYSPDSVVLVNSLTVNIGFEYALGKHNSLVIDVVVPSPFSTRRRFHASAALGWQL
jgi:hypothetical protein